MRLAANMALRNYLYAKHSDLDQAALINKEMRFPRRTLAPKPAKLDCPPEKAIVLEDGLTKCANCADCPKKADVPKVKVELEL